MGPDQPAHSFNLIRIFNCVVWVAKNAKFLHADNEDWSDCADAQADLSLRWATMSEGTAHIAIESSVSDYAVSLADLDLH